MEVRLFQSHQEILCQNKGVDQESPRIQKAGIHLRRKSKRIFQDDVNGDPGGSTSAGMEAPGSVWSGGKGLGARSSGR